MSNGNEDLRLREGDQPLPTPNTGRDVILEVVDDLKARRELGIKRYGTPLGIHNNRSSRLDKYQELLDLINYFKADLIEEEDYKELVSAAQQCLKCAHQGMRSVVLPTKAWDKLVEAMKPFEGR
jgi:hypothetical protein